MNRNDQLHRNDVRPGALTGGGSADGSAIESDGDTRSGTFFESLDRSSIDRVVP